MAAPTVDNRPADVLHSGSAHKTPPQLPWPDISSRGKWSVSSFKFGFGAECLCDGDPDTFWQYVFNTFGALPKLKSLLRSSDGPQPHFVTIEFPSKVAIQKLCIYLSHPQDDSYTPSALAIRAGTGPSDLQDVRMVTFDRPDGWITFDVSSESAEEGDGLKPVFAYVLQVIVVANHMGGKDTHVRGLRVLGPVDEQGVDDDPFPFHNPQYKMFETIR
ncbi:Anaphase-promoting complex subunit 10 [Mycena indigotica]|uniref:Anaphase-promoting complex subunit 10 n=1 Tax=Mycena indigotica TaxID=2126181 RepID=A0A8H6W0R0_9AGAR|nr:Anaphase-promoting complex subunit 10 [Mycena indigotica]KAF7295149.1 Anaphase-promoting complex subunit 10 [Mycena indigotica]